MRVSGRIRSRRWIGIVAGLLAIVAGTTLASPVEEAEARGANTPLSGLLNVVLQGPFVIEKTATNIVVLIPNAPNHTDPLLAGATPLNSRPLNAGDYTLDISDPGSGSAKIANPVAGTTILRAAGKAEHLSSDPNGLRYLRMTLPLPLEVVPWNADPMWMSTVTPIPPEADPVRLAVLVVLRYQYSASTKIALSGKEKDGTPIQDSFGSLPFGNEHFVFLVQGMKSDDVVDHPTALASFDKMKELEPPLARYLVFPDTGGTNPARNQPLILSVEPQDLTDFLASNGAVQVPLVQPKGKRGLDARANVQMLLLHSDCKAPVIYVDYTQ